MFQDTTPFVLALIITFTVLICIAIWNSFNRQPAQQQRIQPEPGPSRTREILRRFSDFYNNLNPEEEYIFDTAILPDPKQHIIHALYVGYDESESEEDKEAIERGLKAIVHFQDLVGEEPLKPIAKNSNSDINPPTNTLFQDLDNEHEFISDEAKKYFVYLDKKNNELIEHLNHLKIEKNDELEPKEENNDNL